jgi:hypothetical protein
MPGQPQINPWIVFDVTKLEIFEASPLNPSLIVPVNGPFTLRATFEGSGIIWEWLKNLNVKWQVSFSAEGNGIHAPDYDLGVTTGNIQPGQNTYQADLAYAGIPIAGVYQIACLVRFTNCPGMTGFNVPLMIEVY